MKKILLIEDSVDVGALIRGSLGDHLIQQAHTMSEGRALLQQDQFDLVLIDVTLPDGNGFDLCFDLSHDLKYMDVPKIIVTANDETADKVHGFNCGAHDYVTKPFHILELKARIERCLPKRVDSLDGEFCQGGFIFSPGFHKCYVTDADGSRVDLLLTPTEFRLFLILVRSEGQTLTRRFLESSAWESNGEHIQVRGVDTHIAHLRKKLGPLGSTIVSVYGQGYVFQSNAVKATGA